MPGWSINEWSSFISIVQAVGFLGIIVMGLYLRGNFVTKADFGKAMEAFEARTKAIEHAAGAMERRVDQVPKLAEFHSLALSVERLAGVSRTNGEKIDDMAQRFHTDIGRLNVVVDRIEDHLLNKEKR